MQYHELENKFKCNFLQLFTSGVIPGFFYKQFLTHIASHGFVAVGVWQLSSPVASFNATWMDHTIQFVERRLQNSLIRNHGKKYRAH